MNDVAKQTGDCSSETIKPRHIAIIMDGNGSWAIEHGLKLRYRGHVRGVETVREITRHCGKLEISYLTLYAFSTENWNRPEAERKVLFALLKHFTKKDLPELKAEGVKVRFIGSRSGLPDDILRVITKVEQETISNTGLTVVIAFNYGGRDEYRRAMQKACRKAMNGELEPETLTEEGVEAFLDTKGIPDPDLIIRTGGEMRLSNFLPWQGTYAELAFSPKRWPEFTPRDLDDLIAEFGRRQRRFGGVPETAQ